MTDLSHFASLFYYYCHCSTVKIAIFPRHIDHFFPSTYLILSSWLISMTSPQLMFTLYFLYSRDCSRDFTCNKLFNLHKNLKEVGTIIFTILLLRKLKCGVANSPQLVKGGTRIRISPAGPPHEFHGR